MSVSLQGHRQQGTATRRVRNKQLSLILHSHSDKYVDDDDDDNNNNNNNGDKTFILWIYHEIHCQ